jgi:hypothetical protein
MSFAVKAETHEGNIFMLRGGFATESDAEDYPVTLKQWKRVWVEPVIEALPPEAEGFPPFPWDWTSSSAPTANGQFQAYLVDANGKKIAAIWGGKHKAAIADHILRCCNPQDEKQLNTIIGAG